jgi:hypothetical protein
VNRFTNGGGQIVETIKVPLAKRGGSDAVPGSMTVTRGHLCQAELQEPLDRRVDK